MPRPKPQAKAAVNGTHITQLLEYLNAELDLIQGQIQQLHEERDRITKAVESLEGRKPQWHKESKEITVDVHS